MQISPALNFASVPLDAGNLLSLRPLDGTLDIKKTGSYEVAFNVKKLKHGFQYKIDPLYITFPSVESAKSFDIDYSIFPENHPERIKGKVHVVLDTKSS